ncbi:MAG: hypothetical protein JWQ07_3223 [Ramlibacter sp.]|nr:hypothetical protein [Ramlibacter sp.]
MCVSGVFEIIVTAINLYAKQTGDQSPYAFLPFASWNRLRPFDLRGQVWLVEKSNSFGTAHALQNFGLGSVVDFAALEPGSFINLNRTNRSGHATVFLAYINKAGDELARHSDQVVGFKYFSSQGTPETGGFGHRYAFFSDVSCPAINPDRKRDCGVIRSKEAMLLNAGVMWHPRDWDKRKALEQLSREAYHIKRGEVEALVDGELDTRYYNGKTTDD